MTNKSRRLMLLIICFVITASIVFLFVHSGTSGLDTTTAKHYIEEHHGQDTAAGNAVTAIYLNYRFWDTLFEALILLISALAVISLSWSTDNKKGER